MSKAAAKEDIVEAAEDHARNLTRMADDLEKYDVSSIPPYNRPQPSEFFVDFLHQASTFLAHVRIFSTLTVLCFLQCCEKCERTI